MRDASKVVATVLAVNFQYISRTNAENGMIVHNHPTDTPGIEPRLSRLICLGSAPDGSDTLDDVAWQERKRNHSSQHYSGDAGNLMLRFQSQSYQYCA